MRVKVCGIRNEQDLEAAAASGADAVGFLIGQIHPSPDFILPGTAERLVRSLPPCISPVIVTHLTDADEIADIVARTGIMTLQLHGGLNLPLLQQLRDKLPPAAKLLQTIYLTPETDFADFMEFYSLANAFLIDSFNEKTGQVGGTGLTNNWDLAAEFVKKSPVPVILAGGLNPGNAAEAARKVKPYALDANSGLKNAESKAVDPELCAAFVRAAKTAL